jgi:hypothetical protein
MARVSRGVYNPNNPRPRPEESGFDMVRAREVMAELIGERDAARKLGDEATATAVDERLDRYIKAIFGGQQRMPDNTKVTATQAAVRAAAAAIAAFKLEASDGHFPVEFVRQREAELRFALDTADYLANRAAVDFDIEARAEAASLRAKAEADRDPAARTADELEYTRLVAGPLNAEVFVERAQALLKAGQPQRATLMVEVARSKGARVPNSLELDIVTALDSLDPDRKAARQIETEVDQAERAFASERAKLLGDVGLGIEPDGSIGHGHAPDIARSGMAVKLAAFRDGETSFPVGDGSNTPGEDAALLRNPEHFGVPAGAE